jgi:hypothetical protein
MGSRNGSVSKEISFPLGQRSKSRMWPNASRIDSESIPRCEMCRDVVVLDGIYVDGVACSSGGARR